MHKVEIRLTHEGDDPSANFEVFTETLKDGNYVELAPLRVLASGGSPIVMFLEPNDRVAVVAKGNTGRLVFDKGQNANIRVETKAEVEERKQWEANMAKSQADQAVRTPPAEVDIAQEPAKVEPTKKNMASEERQAGPTTTAQNTPSSANKSPVDSKQVKKDG